nr:DDB1 and CUL4 associated factor 8 [Hymenolepis microstoma]
MANYNISLMSLDGDMDEFGNLMMSESRFPLRLTDEEYDKVKAKITSDLRIGSSFQIGEKMSFESAFEATKGLKPHFESDRYVNYTRIGKAPLIKPTNLLFSREYGLFRSSAHHYGLYDICPQDYCSTSRADHWYRRWPPKQDFKNHLLGNPWAVASLGLAGVYEYHYGCVNAITFNSSGQLIASGSDDRYVAIMDTFTGDLISRYKTGHSRNVFQVKFLPGSNDLKLVSSALDGDVRLAELRPDGGLARSPHLLVSHQQACHTILFLPDQPSVLLTAGEDGIVYSIDLRSNEHQPILSLPLMPFYSIATNPAKPAEFCVGGKYDPYVKVFDRRKIPSADAPIDGYLFRFAPRHLIGSQNNGISNAAPAAAQLTPPLSNNAEEYPAIESILTERGEEDSDDDDEEDNESLRSFIRARFSSQILNLLNMHSNTTSVASSSRTRAPSAPPENGTGSRSPPGRLVRRFDPLGDFTLSKFCVTSAVYSANGDAILASLNDEDIYLFDSQDDKLPPLHVYRGHRNSDTVKRVNFYGPNSEYIVSGSDDGFIYIWDRHSEGVVQWLCGDLTFAVNAIEPHPYLPMMITCGCDNNVKLWAPMERCRDLSHPGTWLKTIKNKDSSRPPLFDSHGMIQSMLLLRKSELSKRLFGEDEDFRVANEEDEGEIVGGQSENRGFADCTINSSSSKVLPSTSHSRKRNSPYVKETDSSSSSKVIKREDDAMSASSEPVDRPSTEKLSITRAPQHQLPFNYKDLILRVAMNWGKRLRDSTTMMFTLDLPDIFRPLLNLSYPDSDDDDDDDLEFEQFMRPVQSHSQSENSGTAESASTFPSSSRSNSDSSHILDDDDDSSEETSGSRPPTPFPT